MSPRFAVDTKQEEFCIMRKIISKQEEDKKRTRKQFIVGGVLIFIMLFSVIGYSFQGKEKDNIKKINYNGVEFIKQDNFWITKQGNLNFAFKYNPYEAEKINSKINKLENYYGKPLYLSSEDSEASLEIYRNLDQIVQRIQFACLENEKCNDKALPVKTCSENFIVIKESNNSEIKQQENCVFIYGNQENLTQLTDSFLFKAIEITQ